MKIALAWLGLLSGLWLLTTGAGAEPGRTRGLVAHGAVRIDVIAEGQGPLIVMLPSRGRDSEDYDAVAEAIAAEGFRVLRPQPRGIGQSRGPMDGLTLHDFAGDIAAVIRAERAGPAVIVGHAFGNWVARMTAVDHPELVRGVVLAAAAAKAYPPGLSIAVNKVADPSVPEAERRQYLREAFFAPGHDPSIWLAGWYPAVSRSQRLASERTRQAEWWPAGRTPLLDLQAGMDPFKPEATRNEIRDEFGDRVTLVVIPDASHALIPEQPTAVAAAIIGWVRRLP
ncbi:MAG: alpha/beta fold hydrolase [Phreatobacter sp.]